MDCRFAFQMSKSACYKAKAIILEMIIRRCLKDFYELFPSYSTKLRVINKDNLFNLSVKKSVNIFDTIFKKVLPAL